MTGKIEIARPIEVVPLGYGGIPVSFARTADTTAYSANDVVGGATSMTAALEFKNMGPAGGSHIRIINAELEIDSTAVISGQTSYRLYLYGSPPPSAFADNVAWDLGAADRPMFLGYVDLGTPVDLGSTLYVQSEPSKDMKLTGSSVFGYLATNGAYTPASATVYVITLHSVAY